MSYFRSLIIISEQILHLTVKDSKYKHLCYLFFHHFTCTMEQYTCGKDTNVTAIKVLEHRTGILCPTSTYGFVTQLFTPYLLDL